MMESGQRDDVPNLPRRISYEDIEVPGMSMELVEKLSNADFESPSPELEILQSVANINDIVESTKASDAVESLLDEKKERSTRSHNSVSACSRTSHEQQGGQYEDQHQFHTHSDQELDYGARVESDKQVDIGSKASVFKINEESLPSRAELIQALKSLELVQQHQLEVLRKVLQTVVLGSVEVPEIVGRSLLPPPVLPLQGTRGGPPAQPGIHIIQDTSEGRDPVSNSHGHLAPPPKISVHERKMIAAEMSGGGSDHDKSLPPVLPLPPVPPPPPPLPPPSVPPPLCSISDIEGFEELAGGALNVPRIGICDLRLSRAYVQKFQLPEAIDIARDLDNFRAELKSTAHDAHFFVYDYVFHPFQLTNKALDFCKTGRFAPWVTCYRTIPAVTGKKSDPCAPIRRPYTMARILILQGITTLKGFHEDSSLDLLFDFVPRGIMHNHENITDSMGYLYPGSLHLSFYDVSERLLDIPLESWPTGKLWQHHEYEEPVPIRKASISFSMVTNGLRGCEWLMIICCPSGFFKPHTHDSPLQLPCNKKLISIVLLECVTCCVEKIYRKWELVWTELNTVFGESQETSFMDPDNYSHLLYDEDSFPRSRFYFWAIGCLSSFEEDITVNLRSIKAFRERYKDGSYYHSHFHEPEEFSEPDRNRVERLDAHLQDLSKRLENLAERLRKRLADTQALRDGLFSASGVMESRQARILSENVRLLTFVSIFFLPLSFIVAFWSVPAVNETWPGIPYPVVVSAIAGIITYFIVFNLTSFMAFGNSVIQRPRKFLLKNMAEWNRETSAPTVSFKAEKRRTAGYRSWPTRAREFEVFPKPNDNYKPSEWLLVWFGFRLISRVLWCWVLRTTRLSKLKAKLQRPDVESQGSITSSYLTGTYSSGSLRMDNDAHLDVTYE